MKKGQGLMINQIIYQEDIVFINWYAPKNIASKYTKQKSSLWSLYTCHLPGS